MKDALQETNQVTIGMSTSSRIIWAMYVWSSGWMADANIINYPAIIAIITAMIVENAAMIVSKPAMIAFVYANIVKKICNDSCQTCNDSKINCNGLWM
jgi:hypothetical protein